MPLSSPDPSDDFNPMQIALESEAFAKNLNLKLISWEFGAMAHIRLTMQFFDSGLTIHERAKLTTFLGLPYSVTNNGNPWRIHLNAE